MFIQPSEQTTIENYEKICAFCLYESDNAYPDQLISTIRVILYAHNYMWDDKYQGIEIGHMELYRTTSYHSSSTWADDHSGMLLDMHYMKEEVCGDGEKAWESKLFYEDAISCDHFFLTKMYLKPEFRGKKLGYEAMHTGLVECGASHNFVYVYPSRSPEDMGFTFLKKFYMGMDSDTKYSRKYGTIVCPNYNYKNTAKKKSSRVAVKELSHAA